MSLFTTFDHYNLPIGPDGTPFEYIEALRDEAMASDAHVFWSEKHGGFWVVAGWEEAHKVILDLESFSNRIDTFPRFVLPSERPVMLGEYDQPKHDLYRKQIQNPFFPSHVVKVADVLSRDLDAQIENFAAGGSVDISEEFTHHVGSRMTALLCGLDPEAADEFERWSWAISQGSLQGDPGAGEILATFGDWFRTLLDERRANPGDDLISMAVNAEVDGRRFNDDEVEDFFTVVLLGGVDNISFLLNAVFWRLSWDRELDRRLRSNRAMIPTAIEEFLRLYAPSGMVRYVAKDVDSLGVDMREGQMLVMPNHVIHRDPRAFEHPDTFIADRHPNRHFVFGTGIHRCLGMHMVHTQALAAVNVILDRFAEFSLDETKSTSWMAGQQGGFTSVPLIMKPAEQVRPSGASGVQ